MTADRYRSAVTGEYVSTECAKAHPDTTVRETETESERVQWLERRVAELEAELAEAKAPR